MKKYGNIKELLKDTTNDMITQLDIYSTKSDFELTFTNSEDFKHFKTLEWGVCFKFILREDLNIDDSYYYIGPTFNDNLMIMIKDLKPINIINENKYTFILREDELFTYISAYYDYDNDINEYDNYRIPNGSDIYLFIYPKNN